MFLRSGYGCAGEAVFVRMTTGGFRVGACDGLAGEPEEGVFPLAQVVCFVEIRQQAREDADGVQNLRGG